MKVAIVGTAPGYELAPYGDPAWEVWGLNDLYLRWERLDSYALPRFTRWFELHGDTPLTRSRRRDDHFVRLEDFGIPVYYLHGDPPAPKAIKLDTDALARVGRDYFANTNSYQIALALKEGATHISLYGVPLQANREVVVERPCVAWWLGLAEGRGVTVTVEHANPLGLLRHPYRYALEDEDERMMVYAGCEAVQDSLTRWLPHERGRLGRMGEIAHAR